MLDTAARLALPTAELSGALQVIRRIIPRRPKHAILGCVLIRISAGQCTISATNMQVYYTTSIPCDSDPLSAVVPLSALAAAASNGTLDPTSTTDTNEFPLMWFTPGHPDQMTAQVDAGKLSTALACLAYATTTASPRYSLDGICFHGHGGKLDLVASDGHRIVRWRGFACDWDMQVVVPDRAIGVLRKALQAHGDHTVRVFSDTTGALFDGDGWRLATTLCERKFPDYQSSFPAAFDETFTVNSAFFSAAVKSLAALPTPEGEPIPAIRLHPQPDQHGAVLRLSRGEHSIDVLARPSGTFTEHPTQFNAAYLMDLVRTWPEPEIMVGLQRARQGMDVRTGCTGFIGHHIDSVLMPLL